MDAVLITGCSTGIGRALAENLSDRFQVWATARDPETLSKMSGTQFYRRALDVTDESSINNLFEEIRKKASEFDQIHVINNAGVAIAGPAEGVPVKQWRHQFEVNLFSVVQVNQMFLPLIRQKGGRIVNISSVSGRLVSPFLGPYAASKFALEAYSDALRRELMPWKIPVVLIEPGPIQTPIWEKSRRQAHQTKAQLSAEMESLYGETLERFEQKVVKVAESAAPVEWVCQAVRHALTARRPKIRYLVGKGVKGPVRLAELLPDRWADQLIRRF